MKSKKLILSLFGAALAGLWTAQASAAPISEPIGYVELTLDRLTNGGWNGGGRGEFSINRYADKDGNLQVGGIFGSEILYASCIEHAQTVIRNEPRWYAIHENLVGAPSSNPDGMTALEASLIERVVSQKFGLDFLQTDNSFDYDEMAKLQSLLWDAGDPGNTATNPTSDWGLAASAVDDLFEGLTDTVSIQAYALVRVGGLPSGDAVTQVGESGPSFNFNVVEGQDFFTYGPGSNTTTGVPVPAPLLLFGTGLLGLYGTLRRRRA